MAVPVKVRVVLLPEQIVAVPEIVAVGRAFTVIITDPVTVRLQFGVPPVSTLIRSKVVLELNAALVKIKLPVVSKVMLWVVVPPSSVKVAVAPGVPVKVMLAVSPEQIVVLPEIDTLGNALIPIATEPVKVWLQLGVPLELMLTKS